MNTARCRVYKRIGCINTVSCTKVFKSHNGVDVLLMRPTLAYDFGIIVISR